MKSDLTLGPLFKVKRGHPNLKVLISLIIGPRVRSDLTLGPSFKVKRGQPSLKVLITRLLLVLEVWDGKPTYRKSLAGYLLVWSDLTLDPTFKVKRA